MSKPNLENKRKKKDLQNLQELKVLSLFSGCGGMDLGIEGGFLAFRESIANTENIEEVVSRDWVRLKKTRFKTVFANDIFDDARKAWEMHFGVQETDRKLYADSIVELVKRHKNGEKVFPENIDLITGGFPCQDFSIAGKRKGFGSIKNHKGEKLNDFNPTKETRGQLYMWMKEVIDICKPKVFIAENVKGLVNLGNVKDIIQADFSSSDGDGYLVLEPRVLHAANFGIPQNRERVFFVGLRKSALRPEALDALSYNQSLALDPYPSPTHAYNIANNNLQDFVKLSALLNSMQEPENSEDPSHKHYSKAKFMGKHCQGQTEIKLQGIAPTIRSEHHGNIEFRRLSKAHDGCYASELKNNMKERRLTPRECALIQSFPPDLKFVVEKNGTGKKSFVISPSKAYKMIGNAVPPLLAYHFARRLETVWCDLFE